MRAIELRIKQYPKITDVNNLYILWNERSIPESKKKGRWYSFLPDATGEEVALTFKGLHSLVFNTERNLRSNKPQVTDVITPLQSPFLTQPFAIMCKELNIRHTIE